MADKISGDVDPRAIARTDTTPQVEKTVEPTPSRIGVKRERCGLLVATAYGNTRKRRAPVTTAPGTMETPCRYTLTPFTSRAYCALWNRLRWPSISESV